MNFASTFDRLVLCGLALFIVAAFLRNCMASAATMAVSQTVKTASNAAGTLTRVTVTGARIATDTVARPFRGHQEDGAN